MKRRSSLSSAALAALALALSACTHVELSSDAEAVSVREAGAVASCQKVGTASATTKPRVWMFGRSEEAIEDEVTTLGRNEAAKLGGDTLVPTSPIEEGKQTYDVYRCGS